MLEKWFFRSIVAALLALLVAATVASTDDIKRYLHIKRM